MQKRVGDEMQFNASTTAVSGRMLTDLPNISILIAEDLARIGIAVPRQLIAFGAIGAWERLRQAGLHADARVLLALEGAITDLPWQSLPSVRRLELLRHAMAS